MKRQVWSIGTAAVVPSIAWLCGWNFEFERGPGLAMAVFLTVFLGIWQWYAPWWSQR